MKAKKIIQWEAKLLTAMNLTQSVLLISLLSSSSTGSHATLMSLGDEERRVTSALHKVFVGSCVNYSRVWY